MAAEGAHGLDDLVAGLRRDALPRLLLVRVLVLRAWILDKGGGAANRADALCVMYRLMSETLPKWLPRSYSLVHLCHFPCVCMRVAAS